MRIFTYGELLRFLHEFSNLLPRRRFRCIKRVGYVETGEPGTIRLFFAFKWYVLFRRRKRIEIWRALKTMKDYLPAGVVFRPAEMVVTWLEPSGRKGDDLCLKIYP